MVMAPQRLMTLFSPLVIVGTASFIAGIAASYAYVTIGHQSSSQYAVVLRASLTQTVTGTGALRASEGVELRFPREGIVTRIAVRAGDRVAARQLVASLDTTALTAELERAKADLAKASERLKTLQATSSMAQLADARAAVLSEVTASLRAARRAVDEQSGQFIRPNSAPKFAFQTNNAVLEKSVLAQRIEIDQVLADWEAEIPLFAATTTGALAAETTAATGRLSRVETYLNDVAALLTYAVPSNTAPSDDLERLRSVIAAARLSIANTVTDLTASAGRLSVAELTDGPEAAAQQQTLVRTTEAKVRDTEAQLASARLRAPISGTVTDVQVPAGKRVAAGTPIMSMSSDAHAEIAVSLDASEASRVQVGDAGSVRLEQFPDTPLIARVVSVTASGQNAGQYTVVAQLTDTPADLSLGLAGRLTVTVASSSQALVVPKSAIFVKDGEPHVLRLSGGRDELTPVTTGISVDGTTEILSGLSENDKVRSTVNVY